MDYNGFGYNFFFVVQHSKLLYGFLKVPVFTEIQ